MKATLWGTRGSLPSTGQDTVRFGGNTSCVSVEGSEGTLVVLDGGTGIRRLGQSLPKDLKRVNILLTHLHMDHVQGLPFFAPLRQAGVEVHIWGPASTTLSLRSRLLRYLSPPLFPISVRDILSDLHFHELLYDTIEVGEFNVEACLVMHPNPTVGYRINDSRSTMSYLPDHEPALGTRDFPRSKDWTSGYALADGANLLIHDAQYSAQEYQKKVGFGHSSITQAFDFAGFAGVRQLVPFHHDPSHSDAMLERMIEDAISQKQPSFQVTPGMEGIEITLGEGPYN